MQLILVLVAHVAKYKNQAKGRSEEHSLLLILDLHTGIFIEFQMVISFYP